MKKIVTLLIFFISLPASSAGQNQKSVPVKNISFYGTESIRASTVKKWFGLSEDDPFVVDDLYPKAIALLKAYAAAGRPYTRIDSIRYTISADSSAADIRVYIHEGRKMRTGSISFLCADDSQQKPVLDNLSLRPGRAFDATKLERDIDRMITTIERRGHPFAKIDLLSVQIDSLKQEQLNLTWKVSPGPKLIIKEIQIIGNNMTKKKVILRELRIKEGDVYNYDKTSKIQSRLMKLGFFQRVEPAQVFLASGNEGGLLIKVKEGNTSKFDGVVGYTPGAGEEKGYFTGLVDINLGNLFGSGRSLTAHWQKRDQSSQDMLFHYREPWIGGLPLHIGGGFQQLIQDTTYIQRDLSFDTAMPLVESFSIVADVRKTSILPDSVGSYQLGLPKSETVRASIGILYDSRDNLLNPGKGIYYFTSVESGKKKNLGPQDIMQANGLENKVDNKRVAIDVEFYIPTLRRQVLSLALHGRQITSSERFIPVTDQYRLGGTRSLRGYREDQFRGSSIAWANLEYRYLFGPRSRAFVFVDTGYYSALNPGGKSEAFRIGYGFGFRLETGLGIMGIDYGLAYGEKQGISGGLLHVGLVNEF